MEYDTPDTQREEYEEMQRDEKYERMDSYRDEGKDEPEPDPDAVEEARNNLAIDHANDMKI